MQNASILYESIQGYMYKRPRVRHCTMILMEVLYTTALHTHTKGLVWSLNLVHSLLGWLLHFSHSSNKSADGTAPVTGLLASRALVTTTVVYRPYISSKRGGLARVTVLNYFVC